MSVDELIDLYADWLSEQDADVLAYECHQDGWRGELIDLACEIRRDEFAEMTAEERAEEAQRLGLET